MALSQHTPACPIDTVPFEAHAAHRRSEGPKEALKEMARLKQTVEGVPAAGLAQKFVAQHAPELGDQLPLMNAVIDVLSGHVEDVKTRIGQAVLPARP